MKRKPLSKSQRFRIFSRDKFRCRYCGLESDRVTLVVDHIIPVSKGGTGDDANLITSCEDCNAGKSAKELGLIAPTTMDERRIQQEMREQLAHAKLAVAAAQARKETDSLLCEFWEIGFGRHPRSNQTMGHLRNILEANGPENLLRWITIASQRKLRGTWNDDPILKYIYGIRKKEKEKEGES